MARIGDRIGTYEITRLLGSGGMAMVYAAKHTSIGTDHALKVLLPNYASNPRTVERFRQEARAQFRMRHPNIVQVTDFVEDGENLALVMDLIHGMTLAEAIHQRPGPWPVDDVVAVMKPVLEAMTYAHREGLDGAAVVHRDLKPENVMLDLGGDRVWPGVPKVMDFGIAKVLGASNVATATNARMGTPGYMSPEQFKNAKDAGAPADVWALGVMLWQLLAGRLPVDPENSLELIELYRGITAIPPLTKVVAAVPLGLSAAVAQALALDAGQRFADAGPLLRAVELGVARKRAVAPAPHAEPVAGVPPPLPAEAGVAPFPTGSVAAVATGAVVPAQVRSQSSKPSKAYPRWVAVPFVVAISIGTFLLARGFPSATPGESAVVDVRTGEVPGVAGPAHAAAADASTASPDEPESVLGPDASAVASPVKPPAAPAPSDVQVPAPAAAAAPAPSHFFVDAATGTVKDLNTGLVWQRGYSAGTWKAAKQHCSKLSRAGGGWRLPSRDELLGLVDKSRTPTIDSHAFIMADDNTFAGQWFWSATPFQNESSRAWVVDFSDGNSDDAVVTYGSRVRCVR